MATYAFTEKLPNIDEMKRKSLVEYYDRVGRFCDECFEEAAAQQAEVTEVKEIQTALDYLVGLQWKEQIPSYKAKPVSSEIMMNFFETIGLLTDIKPMFNITELAAKPEYSKMQEVLNACAKGWAKKYTFNRRVAFWTMFAMLTSAPAKMYWNPFARGDSGDPGDADITLEVLPTTSLLRLGEDSYDLQDDECVIYRRVRTLNWIKRAYPRMGKHVTAEDKVSRYTVDTAAPVTVMPQLFQNLSPGMKRMVGGSERTSSQSMYPKAEVREYWMKDDSINDSSREVWVGPEGSSWGYWVKPQQRLYPRGRLIVRANGVTLFDEPNPYYHRKKPFILMGLYAVPWQKYALSVMRPWMSQQDILNQIMAGVINTVKKAINPALMAPKSAIHPDALRQIDSSKPNLKISYNSNAATPPQWQPPPNLPAYVFNAYGIVQKLMRQTSGSEAMGDALSKKQVPGGDTLERIQFSKSTPIRHMSGNQQDSLDEAGMMWTGTALQFYDGSRRVEMLGVAGGLVKEDLDDSPNNMIPSGVNSEAFVQKWQFECDRSSLLGFARQDKTTVAFALRKNRDLSRKKLFETIDWNINQAENDAELAAEAQAMAALGPPPKGHK